MARSSLRRIIRTIREGASGRGMRKLTDADSCDAIRLHAIFDLHSEFRLGIRFDRRFAAKTMLIFFSLYRRFFLDIDVA